MKTAKEIFDRKYEFYRNMENKPVIPIEAREMIFNAMEEYAQQLKEAQSPTDEEIYKYANEIYGVGNSYDIHAKRDVSIFCIGAKAQRDGKIK